SPTCEPQPQITSSMAAGSTPVRSTRARSTRAERSTGWTSASAPPRLPTGVRTASTITASRIVPPARSRKDVLWRVDLADTTLLEQLRVRRVLPDLLRPPCDHPTEP